MLLALPVVLLSVVLAVQANIAHGAHGVARHHPRASVPRKPLESPKLRKRKSCNAHTKSIPAATTHTSTHTSAHTSSTKKTTIAAAVKKTTTTPAPAKPTVNNQGQAGTIKISDTHCGNTGATTETTATTGPNGSIEWLDCGIEGSGWNPPYVQVSNLIVKDLNEALEDPNSPFHACSPYTDYFYKYAGEFGLKPIMLAAFAMQESSCNPSTVGGGGEQGIMQITQEKCVGAPGGDCKNPAFNIMTGAKYFAQTLSDAGGNVVLAVGEYNGYYKGLTKAKATAARYSDCCLCQNNLDYLHQFFNGWLQNINAYSNHLGKYFNLDVCPGK